MEPPIQMVPDNVLSEVKQPGREADHSPPSSAALCFQFLNISFCAVLPQDGTKYFVELNVSS
jgi:hypothetical protein